tara:strand:+ start:27420 stop:28418 length:999 start_codon:yes stop_codon:yes gene_type:complete
MTPKDGYRASLHWRTVFALALIWTSSQAAPLRGPTHVHAAVFAGMDDGTRNRFLETETPMLGATLTVNPDFPLDESAISGIAIDSTNSVHQSGVLITPRHYVAADHNGSSAPWFRGSDGVIREYQTTGSIRLTTDYFLDGMPMTGNSDIRIWTLDDSAPLPGDHGVQPMPILTGPPAAFLDRELFVSDQFNRFGRNLIDDVALSTFTETDDVPNQPTNAIFYDYDSLASGNGVGSDEIYLSSGDSGNAAIAVVDGSVALVGNHFGIITDTSPPISVSTWLSPYVAQINEYTSSQAGGYTVSTIVVVPEPSSAFALGSFAIGAALHRRKRRPL